MISEISKQEATKLVKSGVIPPESLEKVAEALDKAFTDGVECERSCNFLEKTMKEIGNYDE